jgi:hypothetical protein
MEALTHLCQVVVHVYGTRIRRLIYETAPAFVDFDEVSFRRASLARGDTQAALLETIVTEHLQLARLLETLPDAEWSREGRIRRSVRCRSSSWRAGWASTRKSTPRDHGRARGWPFSRPATIRRAPRL